LNKPGKPYIKSSMKIIFFMHFMHNVVDMSFFVRHDHLVPTTGKTMSNDTKNVPPTNPEMETGASADITNEGVDACSELQKVCKQLPPHRRTALLLFVKQWLEAA